MFENIRADYVMHRGQRNGAMFVLVVYRFGRWSLARKFPPWRWLTSKIYGVLNLFIKMIFGVYMDRHVRVGKGFHLAHPENLRIGSRVVIGDNVGLMHGVTMATNMQPDQPVIGNNVFIGCNATILGKVKVGDGARVAANSLVVTDVPPGTTAIGVPARIMRAPQTRSRKTRDQNGLQVQHAPEKKRLVAADPAQLEELKN